MTYNQNFVACVKVNGKITREFEGNTVYIPFGTEYTLLLKNLDSRRAVVNVSVDGVDIGGGIVVNGKTEIELERFIKGDLNKGYRFKFIEKTEQISEYRGDKVEDGIIRISFKYELPPIMQRLVKEIHHHHHHDNHSWIHPMFPYPSSPIVWCDSSVTLNEGNSTATYGASISTNSDFSHLTRNLVAHHESDSDSNQINCCFVNNSAGITVNGGDSNQQFQTVTTNTLEDFEHVICIRLLGGEPAKNIKIKKPILVKTKITCEICGTKSKSNAEYCCKCSARIPK